MGVDLVGEKFKKYALQNETQRPDLKSHMALKNTQKIFSSTIFPFYLLFSLKKQHSQSQLR